ncbi:hypothetical protein EOPP23_20880 [Endozoicomonas sp. OPT23]|uniref:DUF3605 domain-containing protein n=1 Tax=Endozoicomonas sp. OPT23 TaxID=2072845 RepID=UPI00129C0121|nr:DUF3605 domain-containing protein [Endozoicomonas sp. OPT23]MRI35418.1 hypothetical protein [Endozoicomonas sp. OPT23]
MQLIRNLLVVLLLITTDLAASPISWEEIRSGHMDSRRQPAALEFYLQRIERIKLQGRNQEEVIYSEVFDLADKKVKKCLADGCSLSPRLVINSYPYWLDEGIYHLLVFVSEDNWDEAYLKGVAGAVVSEHLGDLKEKLGLEWYIHVNVLEKRSVLHLGHAHVFIRGNDREKVAVELKKRIPFSNPDLQPW